MEIPLVPLTKQAYLTRGSSDSEFTTTSSMFVSLTVPNVHKRLKTASKNDDLELLRKLCGVLETGRTIPFFEVKLTSNRTDEEDGGWGYFLSVTSPLSDDGKQPTLFNLLRDKFGERFGGLKAKLKYPDSYRKASKWICYSTEESGVAPNEKGEVHTKLTFKGSTPCTELEGKQLHGGRLHLYLCFQTRASKRKLVEQCLNVNEKMLKMELATDAVIVSGDGKEFKCHRSFLFAHSPVLQAMLLSGMEESRTGRIVVPDMSGEVVEAFLQYLYVKDTSKVAGNCEVCCGLLYAAHKYEVKCLEAHAIELLKEVKNEDYPLDIALKLFVFLGNIPGLESEELMEKAVNVLMMQLAALIALPEYEELDVKTVNEVNKYIVTVTKKY